MLQKCVLHQKHDQDAAFFKMQNRLLPIERAKAKAYFVSM